MWTSTGESKKQCTIIRKGIVDFYYRIQTLGHVRRVSHSTASEDSIGLWSTEPLVDRRYRNKSCVAFWPMVNNEKLGESLSATHQAIRLWRCVYYMEYKLRHTRRTMLGHTAMIALFNTISGNMCKNTCKSLGKCGYGYLCCPKWIPDYSKTSYVREYTCPPDSVGYCSTTKEFGMVIILYINPPSAFCVGSFPWETTRWHVRLLRRESRS